MPSTITSHEDVRKTNGTTGTYEVEKIRQHFPALRGERIPLNNATGSLVYDGAVKA